MGGQKKAHAGGLPAHAVAAVPGGHSTGLPEGVVEGENHHGNTSGSDGHKPNTMLEMKFQQKIRPLLDAVDKLRTLKVTDEGVTLPTIVVVGDQSSGKSSVLESLATISLPRGQGIATRVPLILRLQNCKPNESSICITANDTKKFIRENEIPASVEEAQILLAGDGKGVSDTPISLHIRKPNAPDLTMIDLPGITRVPVQGQPEDIYDQISAMIRRYAKPPETVILNVISGQVDFPTCESIRMSQQEDKEGQRTLAVVTKVDVSPDGIWEKITANDVNIRLGFVCVRNRTDADRSHEEARQKERNLFAHHPNLSKLDKSTVGIGSLADKLTQIQAQIIRRTLPSTVKKIETAIVERQREWEDLTQGLDGKDPVNTFLKIIDDSKTLMENVIVRGKYDCYANDNAMHYPARLDEMFREYNEMLRQRIDSMLTVEKTKELVERMCELKGLNLPNFLSPILMASLVEEEVERVKLSSLDLVTKTHEYARKFAHEIIERLTRTYLTLKSSYKQKLDISLRRSSEQCLEFVKRHLAKERADVYTINEAYTSNVEILKSKLQDLRNEVDFGSNVLMSMQGLEAPIHAEDVESLTDDTYRSAFEMKVSLAGYWTILYKRMADVIAMEIKFALKNALLVESRNKILTSHMGKDFDALMEEDAAIAERKRLVSGRLDMLIECKKIVETL